jgi:hypothetical protein
MTETLKLELKLEIAVKQELTLSPILWRQHSALN